jgi:hypothetical protein
MMKIMTDLHFTESISYVDRVEGRKALAKYLQGIGGLLEFESFATSPKT